MPGTLWNREWLNLNSQRSYPLTEDATKQDQTAALTLPDDFIVALQLPVHAGMDVLPGRFYLQKLVIFGTGFNLAIGYDDGSADPPTVAAAIIPAATHTENLSYAVPGVGDFADSVGQIAIGRIESLDGLAPGEYVFDPAGGKLEVQAIAPMIRYVSGLVLVNGNERSERIYGDIEWIAGNNIRLTPILLPGENAQIRIDAIDGEGLSDDCVCEDENQGPPIRTVNGIPPDINGNFTLLGDECITIEPTTNGLIFQDDCSQPCCGCEELEALTAELEIFGSAATTTRGFVNRLTTEVTQMSQIVLGSLLRDEGCLTCNVGE